MIWKIRAGLKTKTIKVNKPLASNTINRECLGIKVIVCQNPIRLFKLANKINNVSKY